MKNANDTKPGGDGNPGRRKKQNQGFISQHVCRHERRQARRERAYARGGEQPK